MVAGCGRAVRFTRIVLYGVLEKAHNAFPQVIPTSFVDDITQRAEGNMEHVPNMLPRAADILAEGLQEIGCTISPKSAATCNTCEGAAGLNKRFRAYGLPIEVKGMVRGLGVANTSGKRRSAKILEGRFGKAFFTSGRVSRLAKVNRKAKKLFSTGMKPQASWGSTRMGTSPIQVRRLRAMAVKSAGAKGVGKCATSTILFALGEQADPAFYHPLEVAQTWLELQLPATLRRPRSGGFGVLSTSDSGGWLIGSGSVLKDLCPQ